jgi:hypothetical protein
VKVRIGLAVLVVGAVGFVACGDSDESGDPQPVTATTVLPLCPGVAPGVMCVPASYVPPAGVTTSTYVDETGTTWVVSEFNATPPEGLPEHEPVITGPGTRGTVVPPLTDQPGESTPESWIDEQGLTCHTHVAGQEPHCE